MNLHEILTEKVSDWEEGMVATIFLNSLPVADLKLTEESKRRIEVYLSVLKTLPWAYAKEICYKIAQNKLR